MHPTLHNGDFLLTNKISYRFEEPTRGDIIVFKAPKSEPCSEIECEYIKRIIAEPNDRVMVSNGRVYVNGNPLKEDYLSEGLQTSPGNFLSEGVEKVIPEGYFLPLGDNRPASRDGREFGPVSKDAIIGSAGVRYWPMDKIGVVKKAVY